MPEYSSTTITPADAVKVPAQNGSTSGNFQLSALMSYILASKGQANGLAGLGADGKLDSSQIPDSLDDVLVYATRSNFPATGTAGKIYIAADTNKIYRWDDSLGTPAYVYLKVDWTDLTDGTVTVKKAECDASGNTITSTYETKADANDLKNAIDSNTARIENLEQEHGGLVITQYRGSNAVPSGKAKYAMVESIVGKSRAWNNLAFTNTSDIKTYNSSGTWSGNVYSYNGLTFTIETNGSITVAGTASTDTYFNITTNLQGGTSHSYLLAGCPSGGSSSTYAICTAVVGRYDTGSGVIFIIGSTSHPITIFIKGGYSISGSLNFKQIVRDISLIYPEGVPSTVAECVQKCPDILTYDSYGYSLVDTEVEGVVSKDSNDVTLGSFSLPTSVILRSAGSVAEEYDLESGEVTRNIGIVDLSTLNWSGAYGTDDLASLIKKPSGNGVKANMVFSNPAYTVKSVNSDSGVAGSGDAFVNTSGRLVIRASSTPSGYMYYELATPNAPTQLEPIENPYLATESGGTINTIQTQSPVIDNCMDVGYLAL